VPGTADPGVQTVRIAASDSLTFAPSTVAIKTGHVQVVMTVTGKLPQSFTSPVLGVDSGAVFPGHSVTVDIQVPRAGKYAFYSAYHQKQGMKGVLVAGK
jgi:plastocyanin